MPALMQADTERKITAIMPRIIPITDLNAPELLPYAHLDENQLRHYYEPQAGIFIAESPNAILRAMDAGYEPLSLLLETKYLTTEAAPILGRCGESLPVYTSTLSVLSGITGYHLTRGILGAFRRTPLPAVEDIVRDARRIAVLEDIENPTNVGAIFRSAAALSIDAVLLTPACSDPLYRRSIRVSVGTVFQIPWTYIGLSDTRRKTQQEAVWPEKGIAALHHLGFRTAAMALCDRTVPIDDPAVREERRLAILLGNEGSGLLPQTIALSDYTVKIPMSHGVDSLNVAAASAVAFWQLTR